MALIVTTRIQNEVWEKFNETGMKNIAEWIRFTYQVKVVSDSPESKKAYDAVTTILKGDAGYIHDSNTPMVAKVCRVSTETIREWERYGSNAHVNPVRAAHNMIGPHPNYRPQRARHSRPSRSTPLAELNVSASSNADRASGRQLPVRARLLDSEHWEILCSFVTDLLDDQARGL